MPFCRYRRYRSLYGRNKGLTEPLTAGTVSEATQTVWESPVEQGLALPTKEAPRYLTEGHNSAGNYGQKV